MAEPSGFFGSSRIFFDDFARLFSEVLKRLYARIKGALTVEMCFAFYLEI
ncbi:hypothetical protein [Acetomicrobium hydrogeniformans]|uniref:Uncharacterized protein n=1 Tax=Acetomicrobium hydrogeniformans ATCC BAA-1850 TaxID=592015 RepID=A0A0T5XEW4_9BACT|nr:hypothetical protein [Acetomicrobium hydrogeniformans]KRT36478.1 hypothetical protein HMPREF1705_04726 [Acetomicrobium hydrogeniformans ATCC BAA-1850]